MKHASHIGLMVSLGAVLGSGCGPAPTSQPASLPQPEYVETARTGSISGFAWDPEAFVISMQTCNAIPKPPQNGTTAYCFFPPLVTPGIPYYALAAVSGSTVLMLDPTDPPSPTSPPKYLAAPTTADGLWSIKGLPTRDAVPYFVTTVGTGSLPSSLPPSDSGGLPLVPAAPYLPTVDVRPFFTGNGANCPFGEAMHISDRGVLEAVAKYRQAKGQPTAVADFTNPAKFATVGVFFMYQPGVIPNTPGAIPNLFFPANNTYMTSSVGTRYNIAWKPAGTGDSTQSRRGFYVDDKTGSSPLGITVIVVPASASTPPVVMYTPVDTVTDYDKGRPYVFDALPVPPIPGNISAISLQLNSTKLLPDGTPPEPPPWFVCIN